MIGPAERRYPGGSLVVPAGALTAAVARGPCPRSVGPAGGTDRGSGLRRGVSRALLLRPDMNGPIRKWLLVSLAFLVPLGFACFTSHIWEDYLITLRSSRNLVAGQGLVFNPGEFVQTFTSPLGVLAPAFCTWICGIGHETAAIWLFRLASAAALAGAALLLWRRSGDLALGRFGRFVLFGLLLADPKLADFASNGMETGFLVLFTVLLWSELEAPAGSRVSVLALAFAGLMWTRPDGFVLAGALVLPHLWPGRPESGAPRVGRRTLGRAALLGGLFYAPWFFWSWSYYGSPVPHTIVAKAALAPTSDWLNRLLLPLRLVGHGSPLDDLFLPAYWRAGGWPSAGIDFAHVIGALAALAWLLPGLPAAGRRASLTLFIGAFYLGSIHLYPWYLPPWTALAAVALAFVVDAAAVRAAAAGRRWWRAAVIATAMLTVALQITLFLCVAWQVRIQQRVIEDQGRHVIGEWLHEQAATGDRVFLEPLGYIGYYSQLKTYDVPGLSAPEVSLAMRSGVKTYADLITRFNPEWLVLRPGELQREGISREWMLARYRLAKTVDNSLQLRAVNFLPGRPWLEWDARFLVFERLDHRPLPR